MNLSSVKGKKKKRFRDNVMAIFEDKTDFKISLLRKSCYSLNDQNRVTISMGWVSIEFCTLLGVPFNTTKIYRDIRLSILFSLSLFC